MPWRWPGFYLLLRELGHTRQIAAFITLVFLASPLVLPLSFTFMTDIQFVAWMLLALLLYIRALRRRSTWLMFLASLAAGCCIGTRQFGAALVVGLIVVWLFSRPPIRPRLGMMFAGLAVPLLAAVTQTYIGIAQPSMAQAACIAGVHALFNSPLHVLLEEFFWRCSLITQYLGMALLPLLPLAFIVPRSFWRGRLGGMPMWLLALFGAAAIVLALFLGSKGGRPVARDHGLWGALELKWILANTFDHARPIARLLDLFGIFGGVALIVLCLRKLRLLRAPRSLRPETLLFVSTGFVLFLLHLSFVQLNDTYVVGFLPFALLLVADLLRNTSPSAPALRASAALAVIVIVAFAYWLRGLYVVDYADWQSADALHAAGIQPSNIFARWHWSTYHGAFDDWIAEGHPGNFDDWIDRRGKQAQYRVWNGSSPVAPPGWRLLTVRSYRNVALKNRYVLTLERDPAP